MPVLGKVGLVNRGTYSASASYTALDFVLHNGSSYVALRGVSNITPSDDGVNWQMLAEGTAAALHLKNELTYATPGEFALDAAQGPVITGLLGDKAPKLSPTLKFRLADANTAADNPHVELRESGSSTDRNFSAIYYNAGGNTTTNYIYDKNGNFIPSKAPKSHASTTGTTYGQGDSGNYGHVKLSNTYTSSISGGNADGGLAASQNALYNAYTNRAPISHASNATTYGQGNASNFGHVKLSNAYASAVTGGDAAGGIAAAQNALYTAYNTLNTKISAVGVVQTVSVDDSVSVPNNTMKNLASITISEHGRYILIGVCQYPTNTDGRRALVFSDTPTGNRQSRFDSVTVVPVPGAGTAMQLISTKVFSAGDKIYLNTLHTAGTSLSVGSIGIIAIRLTT